MSPDGQRISFQRELVPCIDVCTNEIVVVVVDVDGDNLTNLTNNPTDSDCLITNGCATTPAWSPDGTSVAFARQAGPIEDDFIHEAAIYIMNPTALTSVRSRSRSTRRPAKTPSPEWSPDGSSLVFQRNNARGPEPDGGIALWTISLDTGQERRTTPFDLRAGDTPDWSPEGQRIASSAPRGTTNGGRFSVQAAHQPVLVLSHQP